MKTSRPGEKVIVTLSVELGLHCTVLEMILTHNIKQYVTIFASPACIHCYSHGVPLPGVCFRCLGTSDAGNSITCNKLL